MTLVVRCGHCGGCVVYDASAEQARCLFCDSVALEPYEESVPIPSEAIAFEVDLTRARAAFARWARSSWWHPRALRSCAVCVRPMWIPAWRFEAQVELHWCGLVSAPTRSGRRPRAGHDRGDASATIVASLGLRQVELDALQPFDATHCVPWSEAANDRSIPYELPGLSDAGAREEARAMMIEARRRAVARRERLTRCRASAIVDTSREQLLMLPVWIGSFRHHERVWRFVINAQSGRVHGRAPLDRVKVVLVFALLVLAVVAWWVLTHPPGGS